MVVFVDHRRAHTSLYTNEYWGEAIRRD